MKTLITTQVKKQLDDSIKSARFDGNDCVYINSDRILSLYTDSLTHDEFKNFDWEKSEALLFDYIENNF